eukprot:9264171-Pyramimonas_sp.AAC.1
MPVDLLSSPASRKAPVTSAALIRNGLDARSWHAATLPLREKREWAKKSFVHESAGASQDQKIPGHTGELSRSPGHCYPTLKSRFNDFRAHDQDTHNEYSPIPRSSKAGG